MVKQVRIIVNIAIIGLLFCGILWLVQGSILENQKALFWGTGLGAIVSKNL
jgi:hypothetical protein